MLRARSKAPFRGVLMEMAPRSGKTTMQCSAMRDGDLYVTYKDGIAKAKAKHFGFPEHRALGVGCSLVGEACTGVLRIDDPARNRRDALDSCWIEDFLAWVSGDLMTRMAPGAIVIVTGTPWAPWDALDQLALRLFLPVVRHPGVDVWAAKASPMIGEGG